MSMFKVYPNAIAIESTSDHMVFFDLLKANSYVNFSIVGLLCSTGPTW